MKVHFREGQQVKAGDVLFEIDPRPFEVELRQAEAERDRQQALKGQAEANRQRDLAQMQNAKEQLERNRALYEKGIVSKDEFNTLAATAKALEAAVTADAAAIVSADQSIRSARIAIDNARLQLSYCTLASPIDGRLGNLLVNQGNLVKANADTGMVVINQVRPIHVGFALPEHYLDRIGRQMRTGPLRVTAMMPDDPGSPSTGTLTFIDNQVDRQTGTIRLKAEFPNAEERLWPGQFVNVTVRLSEIRDAVVVSSRAILTGQDDNYCYVVKADKTVESRSIATGDTIGGLVVVTKGLASGERVVLDGQMHLTDGSHIVEKQDATSPNAQ
jgi:multidrug efflux system membrane fusion protein